MNLGKYNQKDSNHLNLETQQHIVMEQYLLNLKGNKPWKLNVLLRYYSMDMSAKMF